MNVTVTINITRASVSVSASTTSASAALPVIGSSPYLRVSNGSATSMAYVTTGGSGVVASAANLALAPLESIIVTRDPLTNTHCAAILASGTGPVAFMPV